jgi:hypothetical protein
LTPNAFQNAFLIFNIALYLAAGVSFICLLLIGFSLYAIIFHGYNAHFAHNIKPKKVVTSSTTTPPHQSTSTLTPEHTSQAPQVSTSNHLAPCIQQSTSPQDLEAAINTQNGPTSTTSNRLSTTENGASDEQNSGIFYPMMAFIGEKRTSDASTDGINAVKEDFWEFLHKRTAFRKHMLVVELIFQPSISSSDIVFRYEHWQLSVIRGTLAIYAAIGLALYLAELAYRTYDSGAQISVATYYAAPTNGFNNVTIAAVRFLSLYS